MNTQVTMDKPLTLPTMQAVQEVIVPPSTVQEVSVEVKSTADQWIDRVIAIDAKDLDAQTNVSREIKSLGGNVEAELVEQSKLLQAPISELMADADNGGDVAQDLLKLEEYARKVDPNGYDFTNVSGFRQFLSYLGLPTPMHQWIAKYQSTGSIIDSIEKGLRQGKEKLERDNLTLKDDQVRYRKCLFGLDGYIEFAQYVDTAIEEKLATVTDEDQQRFLRDEVLFPVRQRHQDLMTSKGVYQQAWVTSEFIIKTNEELVRGVDRALKHTLIALGVASSLAIALARQKKVLVALNSSKEVTEKMIGDISERLLTQGTAIMAQASEPYIQVEVMKSAFSKTLQAMDEVSKYRSDAIQSMKVGINDMKEMTSEMDKNIQRIEQGQQVKEEFKVILK